MDYKTLATILFRITGVSHFSYGAFYAPYLLFTAAFSDTLIMTTLAILPYFAAGVLFFLLSKPMASLVVKGLGLNNLSTPPPPPPRFENS